MKHSLGAAVKNMRKLGHKMSKGESCDVCGHECKYADGGPVLPGADSAQESMRKAFKFADGGEVKGVHKPYFEDAKLPANKEKREELGYSKADLGESRAGMHARQIETGEDAKEYKHHNEKMAGSAIEEHHKVLGELKAMPKPKLKGLAHGGEIKGTLHNGAIKSFMDKGESDVGSSTKVAPKLLGKMDEPYAEGGEVDADGDYDGDKDLMDTACHEFLEAFEKKNKKEMLESLKAIILSMGK